LTRRPRQVSTFVVSALDGYNVSLFAYGQTGSGKTHTVLGGADEEQRGIVPRAVNLILSTVAEKARAPACSFVPSFVPSFVSEFVLFLDRRGCAARASSPATSARPVRTARAARRPRTAGRLTSRRPSSRYTTTRCATCSAHPPRARARTTASCRDSTGASTSRTSRRPRSRPPRT